MSAFKCPECGESDWTAHYYEATHQGILLVTGENGEPIPSDYTGADYGRDDDAETGDVDYQCNRCGEYVEVARFRLLPNLAPAGTWEGTVYDSEGSFALQLDGQDVAHLVWTDRTTAADEYAEPHWRTLTDAERDRILEVIWEAFDLSHVSRKEAPKTTR